MKSSSRRETVPHAGIAGRPLPAFALAFLLALVVLPVTAQAGVSLTEMARLEASEEATIDGTRSLFRGYLSLGLLPEAASLLERRVRMGMFPLQEAIPLFENVVAEQGRFDDPRRLVAVCESAIRSGVRTSAVLYHYGTGLRGIGGRFGDASSALAQVGTESPYRFLAVFSLGQIAAEKGEIPSALDLYRRAEEGAGGIEAGGFLAARAARSRAEALLSAGRGSEAAPVFTALLRIEENPMDRIGLAAAGEDSLDALERLPSEMISGLPLGDRARFHLLLGGVARSSGRDETAVDRLVRAGLELDESLSLPAPPSTWTPVHSQRFRSLRLQLEGLRALRPELFSPDRRMDGAARDASVEFLAGLLLADRTVARIAAEASYPASIRYLDSDRVAGILRRIEAASLGGVEVDRLVERMAATLDTFQNLGHPIARYRRLAGLETSQKEIRILRDRIRDRRVETAAAVEDGREGDVPRLLKDLGLFLKELERIRSVAAETREYTKQYFDILRRKDDPAVGAEETLRRAMRESAAYADGCLTELFPVVRMLEDRERSAAWDRRKPELLALRAVVGRQLADTLVGQARRLRFEPGEPARGTYLAALGRAVSLLAGGRLAPGDAADVAVGIGSVLVEGKGRWVRYPGAAMVGKEKEWIGRVLPLLPREGSPGTGAEEGLYLGAALRYAVKDPAAGDFAGKYLSAYPATPLSAEIGVRLGHEALLAGNAAAANSLYGPAAESGNPDASAVAGYMLALGRFRAGDAEGALRELSRPLSDPSFPCANPSSFEQAVVRLSVRAWREPPLERLASYLPVKAGTCGGKALLSALREAEEKRGDTARAVEVRDIAVRRFPSDANAAALEMETAESLLRAGREEEALGRALDLPGRYGPGSPWALSQAAPVAENAARVLAAWIISLSGRMFDDGIRTGRRSALSSSAALTAEYFRMKGEGSPDEDGELRLKWAVALLGSGDREGGLLLLEELIGEQRGDAVGERAAVLHAETMVAGYERKETSAEDAEDAVLSLLEEHPSEKSASLAVRASSAFLSAGEYDRALRTSERVEGGRSVSPAQVARARVIQAEAALFEGNLAAARGKASLAIADTGGAGETATRARDLYLLSTLKEVEGMEAAGDPSRAAAVIEEITVRFPGAPEAPMYLLRSMRLYAKGGDAEGAIRTGLRFRREYPRREEAVEVADGIGPLLEGKKEFAAAGELYETVAEGFPKGEAAPRLLFHAARLAADHGLPEAASRRFAAFRARFARPRWMWAYATLSLGLAGRDGGETKASMRRMEEGLRRVDAGVEKEAPRELAVLAGKARIAVGEDWAGQFRRTRLLVPLDKSLAAKDWFFRRALGAFEKAEREAPLEVALDASLRSGDLFVEYGKAIQASQRPNGLMGSDREGYEEALRDRTRSFYERSLDRYAGALDRVEHEEGPGSSLAAPIRKRLETARTLLEKTNPPKEGKAP